MKNDNQACCYINKDRSVTIVATDRDVARMVCALLWHLAKHGWSVMSAHQYMVSLSRIMGDPMAAPGFDKGTVTQWGADALVELQKDHAAILQAEEDGEFEDDDDEAEEEDEPEEELDGEEMAKQLKNVVEALDNLLKGGGEQWRN